MIRTVVAPLILVVLLGLSACRPSDLFNSARCDDVRRLAAAILEDAGEADQRLSDWNDHTDAMKADSAARLARGESVNVTPQSIEATRADQKQRLARDVAGHMVRWTVAVEQNPDCFTADQRIRAEADRSGWERVRDGQ